DTEPAITDPAVKGDGEAGGTPAALKQQGRLRFDRVTFRYPGARAPLLRGVSLELEPGETVALGGPTGAGQTPRRQLGPRRARGGRGRGEVPGGAILRDGPDVRALPLARLRAVVGCAFEDPTLFSASVRENVSYGVPGADEEAVVAALAAAQADFVADLPW